MIGRTKLQQPAITFQHRNRTPQRATRTRCAAVRDSASDRQDRGEHPVARRTPDASTIPRVFQSLTGPSV